MFETLSLLAIIIGITSLLVNLYYKHLLANILTVLSKLLKLQNERDGEIETYIQNITKNLQDIGVTHISYDIVYLGKRIYRPKKDTNTQTVLKKDIYYKNIDGYIIMEVSHNKGEYKLINRLILFVVTLQIVNAIHTEIEKINESFTHMAKLQTYMMHDLKNILQFFQAMQYNVEGIRTQEQKEKFITFLQNSTQPINKKVTRILSLLQIRSNFQHHTEVKEIHLNTLIKEYVEQYHLQCDIDADVTIICNEESLRTIIENILSNIHYKSADDPSLRCNVKVIEEQNSIIIRIQDSGSKFANPQSVTHPFYTTKEEGLGIGMYQAQTLTEFLGGSLNCQNEDEKPTIVIRLPKV